MNKYYQVELESMVSSEDGNGDEKITNTKQKYLVYDVSLEAAITTIHNEVIPNLVRPSIKSVKDTSIMEVIGDQHGKDVDAFKAKVAYITDHPTRPNKQKTIFEYVIVYADGSKAAHNQLNEHISRSSMSDEFRIDSIALVTFEEVINTINPTNSELEEEE